MEHLNIWGVPCPAPMLIPAYARWLPAPIFPFVSLTDSLITQLPPAFPCQQQPVRLTQNPDFEGPIVHAVVPWKTRWQPVLKQTIPQSLMRMQANHYSQNSMRCKSWLIWISRHRRCTFISPTAHVESILYKVDAKPSSWAQSQSPFSLIRM